MTYTFLNQRIFGIKLFEHPTDLDRLAPFFYKGEQPTDEIKPILVVESPVEEKIKKEIKEIKSVATEQKNPPRKQSIHLPKDNLFWNIFISVYGLTEYKLIGSKYMNREWEEKNNIRAAYMNKLKELQTTNQKITLGSAKEMLSEYMTGGKTSLLGVIGMAVYYKIAIYLFDDVKKIYLPFVPQSTDHPTCILFKTSNDRSFGCGYELYSGEKTLETLCEESFGLESYQKPLRAISTYKRAELNILAEKHGISFYDKSKDEVYRALSQHLVWLV
jgi:hypothetical protein